MAKGTSRGSSKAMEEQAFRSILADIEEVRRAAPDLEDLPELPPHEFHVVGIGSPGAAPADGSAADASRRSWRCAACWSKGGFAWRYDAGHPRNALCEHCTTQWAPAGRFLR